MQNKRVVLVVEDEKPLQEAIKIKLEKTGFDVVTARSVEQAINHLEDIEKIDAVWLDHYLFGREDGLDFLSKCKECNSKFRDIPIFVVSNTATPEKVQTYIRLGAIKYYVKAEKRLDEIIQDINNYLDNPKE